MNASSPWLKLFREQRKSEKRREKLTQQEMKRAAKGDNQLPWTKQATTKEITLSRHCAALLYNDLTTGGQNA